MRIIMRSLRHAMALAVVTSPLFAQDAGISIVVSRARLVGNAEALLREHGFNHSSVGSCSFRCSARPRYPHTEGGRDAPLFTIRRRWKGNAGLALTYQLPASSGRSVGYRSPGYSTSIEPHVQMLGVSVYSEGPSGGRMAAGPALFHVRTVQSLGSGAGRHETKMLRVGALAELGFTWPRRSKVYVDAAVQGRIVPWLRLEPQEIAPSESGYGGVERHDPLLFPGGTYTLFHAGLILGLGIRF